MKVTLIYDLNYPKLQPEAYSQSYRGMLLALIDQFRYDTLQIIHNDDVLPDPNSDVIIFYDIHSSHDIYSKAIRKHSAIKYEYFDDPHQLETKGIYPNGTVVHKLGAEQRCARALLRGIDYIICPYHDAYFRFLAPHLGKQAEQMLVHFPISPDIQLFTMRHKPLADRLPEILGNGAIVGPDDLYTFRKWAFCHPRISHVEHWLRNSNHPKGAQYPDQLLAKYAGALAMASWQSVPKYFEIPLAGCVAFMQWNSDAYRAGFRHGENCIFVEKWGFNEKINHFLNHIIDYQSIADKGRELVEHHYTAQHFASFIYNHIGSRVKN